MSSGARPVRSRLQVWRSFLHVHARIVAELERELAAERQLPLGWYAVLAELADAGGRLRMQDLATRLVVPRSSLSRLVDRMEAEDLIGREPSDVDGRGVDAVITATGRTVLRRAVPVHRRGIEEHFASKLDGTDVAALKRALAKLDRPAAGDDN